MKQWLFPIYFLIWLFCNQLLSVYLSLTGSAIHSGMLQRVYIPIAAVSYILLFNDLRKYNNPGIRKIIGLIVAFFTLYLLSSAFIMNVPYEYTTRLLRFGSICIAGVAIAIHLNLYPAYEKIEKLLPFFIFVIVLTLGVYGFNAATQNTVIREEEGEGIGLNYQNYSYYMAEAYSYCLYYLFFSKIKGTHFHSVTRIPMLFIMVLSGVLCLLGGGRGPFIFFIVLNVLFVYFYSKQYKVNAKSVTYLLVLGFALFFAADYFNVFNTVGYTRVVQNMFEDDSRNHLYMSAWNAFKDSPILGNGLGSVWWTVGWACHNMYLDILAEGGVILGAIILYYMFSSFATLWRSSIRENWIFLPFVIFLEAIVENSFSGYWVSCQTLWFGVAFAICYKYTQGRAVLN